MVFDPEAHSKHTLVEPDNIDSNEILETRAYGLVVALRGWSTTQSHNLPREEAFERGDYLNTIQGELISLFSDLNSENCRCDYNLGPADPPAHQLLKLGEDFALFNEIVIQPGSILPINYLAFHRIPQNSRHDLPHGFADHRQLYLGSTTHQFAISLNQLAYSFSNGAALDIKYKDKPQSLLFGEGFPGSSRDLSS